MYVCMYICMFWIKQNEQIDITTFLDNKKRIECAAFRSQLGQVFLVYVGSFFKLFFVQFSCWFVDRFLIVLGVPTWGVFGAKNRSKCDLWVFDVYWFYIGFSTTFASWGGLMLVRCWFFFRIVFCIDFLSIWGSILEPFWEPLGGPNRYFLALILGWFLHVVPRAA